MSEQDKATGGEPFKGERNPAYDGPEGVFAGYGEDTDNENMMDSIDLPALQPREDKATAIGIGFWRGAGIPAGERVNTFAECGCCGAYHRTDFNGDCREDSERHYDIPEDAVIVGGGEL